jgi:integrase
MTTLLQRCTAATLTIDNQKNGKRGSVIHHEATPSIICPIKAIIRRVCNITSSPNHTPNTIIGTHFNTDHPNGFTINSSQITSTLRKAVKALNLETQGITPSLISSHSLRAGGATALHLNGFDTKTIQIMGRWSSDTFLTYIHHQISAFSHGMSSAMATNIPFHNTQHLHVHPAVGDIILPQSPAPLLA